MVEISYAYKKIKEFREREKNINRIFYTFRINSPTRITNIIINTVNIARLF